MVWREAVTYTDGSLSCRNKGYRPACGEETKELLDWKSARFETVSAMSDTKSMADTSLHAETLGISNDRRHVERVAETI